jgi:formylglycine-generating enzyme
MTTRSKAELKALFEDGDQPDEDDFGDLIDTLYETYEDAEAIAALNAAKMTFLNVRDPNAGDCVYIPPFTVDGISGITFGGFLVQKFPASQPNATAYDDNPDVADGASVGATKAFSQPGVSPWREITSLEARKACANIGTGWHLISAFEWASLAYWAQKMATQPHGPNGNTNPPADATYTTELGIRDYALAARGAHDSALTGSGPVTWSHNWRGSGVYGLNGVLWQWNDGLFLLPESHNDDSDTPHEITAAGEAGYCLILANREVSLESAPYGESTATAAGSLTDSNKDWPPLQFAGRWLLDADGSLFYIDDNIASTLNIDGASTPASGPYTILKLKETNITSGMTSGNHILTLSSDSDLEPLAIPATSDGTGSDTYGNDGYWFSTSALRAAVRGGTWANGVKAGVFALGLTNAPSDRYARIGFRACKSL